MPRRDPSLASILAGSKSESFRRLNGSMFPPANIAVPVAQVKRIRPDETPGGPRYRSQWEAQFHEVLKARLSTVNATVEHEPMKLRLADGAYFKPDFLVVENFVFNPGAHGFTEWTTLHRVTYFEVKGHWREAARVRIKVAARLFPWARFVAVVKQKKRDGGGWKEEAFSP